MLHITLFHSSQPTKDRPALLWELHRLPAMLGQYCRSVIALCHP